MFDTVRSSYDLGPGFHRDLQTKDLECCMCEYWIDPTGKLFEIDYSGTHDFLDVVKDKRWPVYKTVPNGNHGKVRPVYIFKVIEVYPAKWDCKYAPFPSCQVVLYDGKLVKVVRRL